MYGPVWVTWGKVVLLYFVASLAFEVAVLQELKLYLKHSLVV
jgi:hypothetical protein